MIGKYTGNTHTHAHAHAHTQQLAIIKYNHKTGLQ